MGWIRSACVAVGTTIGFLGSGPSAPAQVTWKIDNIASIGGHATTVIGNPTVVESPWGSGVQFDGSDGLVVDANPIAGAAVFTMEMIFRPDPIENASSSEPRILHVQSFPSPPDHRAILEGRIASDDQWYLDAFLRSHAAGSPNPSVTNNLTLIDPEKLHPLGEWYNFAMVYDGAELRAYLNGELELSGPLEVQGLAVGRTSLGMRINQVNFFEGVIALVRFSPMALEPEELLPIEPPPGDYDKNGRVDATDFDTWHSMFGTSDLAPGTGADGNGDGTIDAADYTVWRDNLSSESPAASQAARVPEPASLLFVALACLAGMRLATRGPR